MLLHNRLAALSVALLVDTWVRKYLKDTQQNNTVRDYLLYQRIQGYNYSVTGPVYTRRSPRTIPSTRS
jgi:hypothetical protein